MKQISINPVKNHGIRSVGLILMLLLLVQGAAAASVLVAASDSSASARSAADYRCDGSSDQVQINQALDRLAGSGGVVNLAAGTFHCDNFIYVPGAITLTGQGEGGTTIEMINSGETDLPITVNSPEVSLSSFTLRGTGYIKITTSQVTVTDVAATNIGTNGHRYPAGGNGMFFIWADGTHNIEDVSFINCRAVDCNTHGFNLNAKGTAPKETRNIRFINCQATRCGFGAESRDTDITGFDLQEENDVYDIQLIGCIADDNWESGFHFEPGEDETPPTVKQGIVIRDCISRNNGQRNTLTYPYHTFMSGFFVSRNAVLTNCKAINNRNAGFFVQGGRNIIFNDCTDDGSSYGWKIVKWSSGVTLNDCTASDNKIWALWSAFADHITLNRFVQDNAGGLYGTQSMLGWYYGEPAYEQPVNDSYFDITAYGNHALPIINFNGTGNIYYLRWGDWPGQNGTAPPPTSPAQPNASFIASPSTGFAPLAVQFTDTTTGVPTDWYWDFGDGTTSSEQNPSHTYTQDGLWTVTLHVGNALGDASTQQTVAIGTNPHAGFTTTDRRVIDAGGTIHFTDTSTGHPNSWLWDFGDLTTSTDENPIHRFLTAGIFMVKLIATYGAGTDTEVKSSYITVYPVAQMGVDVSDGAAPMTVHFTDRSYGSPSSRLWDFGDGSTSIEQNPVHIYPYGGTYTVTLTVEGINGGPIDRATATLSVTGAPSASFTATPAGTTPPVTVTFLDRSIGQIDSRFWSFGDGTTSTEQSPVHTYSNAGTYNATLTTSNRWGSSSTTLQVNAGDPPYSPIQGVIALPGQSALPTDPNRERLYKDLNGDGAINFNDVVLYFNEMDWISDNEPVSAFDFNKNGKIDFDDIVFLFNLL
ncbi:PKD domain containing protein [Methanosphaerula palustris E1-9c]|uniref:Probable pectate lyase C n=2 Tax=Methanosphaerula palustris TaxID=475088 RepID=B8GEE8_METPE|nr:PKD domain containing protein [Methanosphaerula palustris E1-9c]